MKQRVTIQSFRQSLNHSCVIIQAVRRRSFVPFITAGDPDLETTGQLLVELAGAGASVIELGVPFSDPMADGAVIQRASERALKASAYAKC
jgi:tryptophan synthase alpha chain